jgi:hypothetical protein
MLVLGCGLANAGLGWDAATATRVSQGWGSKKHGKSQQKHQESLGFHGY